MVGVRSDALLRRRRRRQRPLRGSRGKFVAERVSPIRPLSPSCRPADTVRRRRRLPPPIGLQWFARSPSSTNPTVAEAFQSPVHHHKRVYDFFFFLILSFISRSSNLFFFDFHFLTYKSTSYDSITYFFFSNKWLARLNRSHKI